jgi:hypothetical protein
MFTFEPQIQLPALWWPLFGNISHPKRRPDSAQCRHRHSAGGFGVGHFRTRTSEGPAGSVTSCTIARLRLEFISIQSSIFMPFLWYKWELGIAVGTSKWSMPTRP